MRKFLFGVLLGFFLSLAFSIFAWVNPPGNPPSGGGVIQTDSFGLKIITSTQITSGNFIVSNGNVGIGTTNPYRKLEVADSVVSPVNSPWGGGANSHAFSIFAYDPTPPATDKVLYNIEGAVKELGATSVSGNRIGVHGTLVNSSENDWYLAGALAQQSGPFNRAYGVVGWVKSCPPGYQCFSGFFGSSGGNYNFVIESGNVGIGTTDPTSKLTVQGPIESSGWFDDPDKKILITSPTGVAGIIATDDTGHRGDIRRASYGWDFAVHAANTIPPVVMTIHESGNVGIGTTDPGSYKLYVNGSMYASSFYCASDIRLKKEIKELDNTLEKVLNLNPISFVWNEESEIHGKKDIGISGQEIEKYFPELVNKDSKGYINVDYSKLSVIAISAIKEQQKIIEEQAQKIKTLEEKINKLEEMINKK